MSNIIDFTAYRTHKTRTPFIRPDYPVNEIVTRAMEIKNQSMRPFEDIIADKIGFTAWAAAKNVFTKKGE